MPGCFLDVATDSTSLLRVSVCFTDDTSCLAPYWLARPPRPFSLSAWPSRFSRGGVPTCDTPFHACLAPSHRVQGLDSRFLPSSCRADSCEASLHSVDNFPLVSFLTRLIIASTFTPLLGPLAPCSSASQSRISPLLVCIRAQFFQRASVSHDPSTHLLPPCFALASSVDATIAPPPWIFSALLRHHARPATYTGFAFPGCAASAVSHDPEALFRTFAYSLVSCRCQAWASIRQLTVTDHGFLHDGDTHRPAFSLWGISLKPWITFTRCGGQLSRFASFQPCSAPVVYRQPLAACAARSCRIRHPPLMGFLWISTPHIHAIFPTTASVNGRFGDRRLATPACENTGLHRFMPSFMDCSVL